MQTITLEFKKHPMKPPKFLKTYPRLKFTLILLALLFIGVAAKADVPCHTAIEVQQATIDSLQAKLATAQSVPYNQGYQEGYKVAKLEGFTADEIGSLVFLITFCLIFLGATTTIIINALKD
jgi:hypothetical protein